MPASEMESLGGRPVLRSVFSDVAPCKVLDFGGGDGTIAKMLQDLGHDVTLVDIDDSLLDMARQKGIKTIQGDDEVLETMKGDFDMAVMSHIIEHIQCPHERVLPRIFNALREDGRLVVSTPNTTSLRNRLRFIRGSFPDGVVYQHVRFFTMESLTHELEAAGFVVERAWTRCDGPVTRIASTFSSSMGDELFIIVQRPPGPDQTVAKGQVWQHC